MDSTTSYSAEASPGRKEETMSASTAVLEETRPGAGRPPRAPVIQVEHLAKRYGATVEVLQGLREADSGRIRVLGLDPHRDARRLRGLVGAQLQESALPEPHQG